MQGKRIADTGNGAASELSILIPGTLTSDFQEGFDMRRVAGQLSQRLLRRDSLAHSRGYAAKPPAVVWTEVVDKNTGEPYLVSDFCLFIFLRLY